VLEGGICEFLWLGDNDVTLSMVKRAYQNFNTHCVKFPWVMGNIFLNLNLGELLSFLQKLSC
jgi:hypothetical protein